MTSVLLFVDSSDLVIQMEHFVNSMPIFPPLFNLLCYLNLTAGSLLNQVFHYP